MATKNRLIYRNNWCYDEYHVDGERILSLKEVMISEKTYKVKTREIAVPYSDMGHEYTATSNHYFIEETVFGMKMEFDMNTVTHRVAVYATKFTLDKR